MAEGCGELSVECQLLCLMFVWWLNCTGEGVCVWLRGVANSLLSVSCCI